MVNLIILPVGFINWLIGSNYMYLCTKPGVESPFLIGEWPWYLIGLEGVALLLMAIATVPMIFLHHRIPEANPKFEKLNPKQIQWIKF